MTKLKIGVAFHKDYRMDEYISNKDIYIPIHCGRSIYYGSSHILMNFQTDNDGENISNLNKFINEITGIYWFGKHYDEIGNPDYFGFFHYRRFLEYNINDLDKKTIFINSFDFNGVNIYDQIIMCNAVSKKFLNKFISFFLENNKEDRTYFKMFLNETFLYGCNIFIMPRDIFKKYFEFLLKQIEICKLFINLNDEELKIHPRALGMILERLTGFYIYKLEKQGLNIKQCRMIEI